MPARILKGEPIANAILASLKPSVNKLSPTLAIVQVGNDPASDIYVGRKLAACDAIGMGKRHVQLKDSVTFDEMLTTIHELNDDPAVTGYLIQLPLPDKVWKRFPELAKAMDPKKDVDGLTAYNLGKLALSTEFEHLVPATARGVIHLLETEKIDVEGKEVVIIGHSNIVGKPIALMLLNRLATVTVCHAKTKDLASHTKRADILVSAVGKPGLVTADMVKDGVVVIDIGTTKQGDKLLGDVDFEAVSQKASAITPVPGGIGPLTVACLLQNVITAAERQR